MMAPRHVFLCVAALLGPAACTRLSAVGAAAEAGARLRPPGRPYGDAAAGVHPLFRAADTVAGGLGATTEAASAKEPPSVEPRLCSQALASSKQHATTGGGARSSRRVAQALFFALGLASGYVPHDAVFPATRPFTSRHILPEEWQHQLENPRPVGGGSFGSIFKCDVVDSDLEVAVKVCRVSDPARARIVWNEIEAMEEVGGGDVVKLHRTKLVKTEDGTEADVFMLMEAADDDLSSLLSRVFLLKSFPMDAKLRLTVELLRGLAQIAGEGYAHLDIRPENILLFGDCKDPKNCHVKIADFGNAILSGRPGSNTGITGTLWYIAPEIWAGDGATDKSDVWSAGMVLYELFAGGLPDEFYNFVTRDELDFATYIGCTFDIQQDPAFKKLDKEMAQLIQGMLTNSPTSRISIDRALLWAKRIADERGVEVPEQPPAEVPFGVSSQVTHEIGRRMSRV
mmetsp:Transcript_81771/g.236259  ORF Transcript_81771/g.236259 Transcript_81771/m.236259 type:complete len:456 (-) Transcript_81771:172-1539(-)